MISSLSTAPSFTFFFQNTHGTDRTHPVTLVLEKGAVNASEDVRYVLQKPRAKSRASARR